MSNNSDNIARPDVQADIIELGVASIQTMGSNRGIVEPDGLMPINGISED